MTVVGSPPRICPGCRQRVVGVCERCERPVQRRESRAKQTGYGRNERRRRADTVRVHVEQYGWVCPGWQRDSHPADDLTADHIQPTARGGESGGPLRVLCRPCNSARQASLDTPNVPGLTVTLICGPPGGGKSTYLLDNAAPGDLVVDYDRLAVALQVRADTHEHVEAHRPFICEARDAVLDRLVLGNHGVRRAWIIHNGAHRKVRESFRRRYNAQVVLVWSPEDVCLRRAMGQRPDEWFGYVRRWFSDYEPDTRDVIVKGYDPGGSHGGTRAGAEGSRAAPAA